MPPEDGVQGPEAQHADGACGVSVVPSWPIWEMTGTVPLSQRVHWQSPGQIPRDSC